VAAGHIGPLDKYRMSVYTGNRVRITRMLDGTSRWKVGQRVVSDRVRVVDEHVRRSATRWSRDASASCITTLDGARRRGAWASRGGPRGTRNGIGAVKIKDAAVRYRFIVLSPHFGV
jgi:hypothetical protein